MASYQEYQHLKSEIDAGNTKILDTERFKELDGLIKQRKLNAFISFISPTPFFICYSSVVGVYIALGGLKAAAITDAVQGLLILIMSILLIPVGLNRIGGFSGLHRIVPEYLFSATASTSWYAILAITFASLVQIVGLLHNMSTAGSAKDENTARFGMISGGFTKRLVLIAWTLCGMIGLAVLSGSLRQSDPDNTWGALSRELLGPGLMGLMLSGMLLGNMPSMGVYSVSVAGLATRNIYEPLVKGKTEKHYFRVGQFAIAGVLIFAVMFAECMSDVASAYTDLVTFNTFFGAAVFLILFWRQAYLEIDRHQLSALDYRDGNHSAGATADAGLSDDSRFPEADRAADDETTGGATSEDVAAGRAQRVGQAIKRQTTMPPTAVYFETVTREDPEDPNSPQEGIGPIQCRKLFAIADWRSCREIHAQPDDRGAMGI